MKHYHLFPFLIVVFYFFTSLNTTAFDLSGKQWEIQFDKSGGITADNIRKTPANSWQPVIPGIYWDLQGYPREKNNIDPRYAWYKCKFRIPADFTSESPVLHIGAIDDLDETWIDNIKIGSTGENTPSYWNTVRLYAIPRHLLEKNSEHEILIRITDLKGYGGISALPIEIVDRKYTALKTEQVNPLQMSLYAQRIELEFNSEAEKADISIAPLFNGKKWAFSARWDDNNLQNLKMHDLMKKYGYKGTFYLYSDKRFPGGRFGEEYARKLIYGGFSIGGHSMTHPPFTQITRNGMFYEALAIKIERETDTNIPVISFAFPGGDYTSQFDTEAHAHIGEALKRSGYHHNTYRYFVNPQMGIDANTVSSAY